MPCFSPLKGYQSNQKTEKGKYKTVFSFQAGYTDIHRSIPCGQCIGCRLERSRQWAIRCVHEASLYNDNCFITLTFNPEFFPADGSLHVRHLQLFMKRLRKRYKGLDHVPNPSYNPDIPGSPETIQPIRFYACGEYGSKLGRPHYHSIIFNFDFSDKKLWKIVNGQKLYVSQKLQDLWSCPKTGKPLGFCSIGSVTFQSAAYVARYIMKKITGNAADSHYESVDEDGVVTWKKPEFTVMSRNPGIAKSWFDKYKTDVYPGDFVVMNNAKMRPPKFYDTVLEKLHNDQYLTVKKTRRKNISLHSENNTPERLRVREQVQLTKLKQLPRILD